MQIQNFRKGSMVEKLQRIILYLFVILLPFLVTSLLLHFLIRTDISQYQPVWTDEVDYWVQINAFKDVGFNSGYFSINELTSKSEFSHYGTHGPMFPLFYGGLAKLFGWFYFSGPLFNLWIVSLSLFLFLWMTKPDRKQMIFIIIYLLFFYQLFLYIPTTMQESLNISFAILFSAFFVQLFKNQDKRLSIQIGLLVLIVIASLFRIIWVFTIFPILYKYLEEQKSLFRRLILSTVFGLLFTLIMIIIYNYWTSPYPGGFLYQLTNGSLNLNQLLHAELKLVISNLKKLFGINLPLVETEIFIRYLYLIVIITLGLNIKKQKKTYLSLLFILVTTLFVTILIYDIGNFRILAPFLLFCLFALVFVSDQFTAKYLLLSYLVISLLTSGNFITNYRYFHLAHFSEENIQTVSQQENLFNKIQYIDSNSSWCNSLLTDQVFTRDLLNVPAGIGVNVIKDLNDDKMDIKSHYLLVPYDFLAINGIVSTCQTIGTYSEDIFCERINDNCN